MSTVAPEIDNSWKYIQEPYEISVWNDVFDENGNLVEQKTAIIGASNMESPFRAVEPSLTMNVNGTQTLKFTMYYRMWDNDAKSFIDNPFVKYLSNETKIKLKLGTKWSDFVIKQIQESQEKYSFTYTAQDLFINELSKTGYNLNFDTDFYNNTGSINELASAVLDGTNWSVDTVNSDIIYQTDKDYLFTATLNQTISAVKLEMDSTGHLVTTTESLVSGSNVLLFYGSCAAMGPIAQFMYLDGADPQKDSEGFLTNATQYAVYMTGGNYTWDDGLPSFCAGPLVMYEDGRGKRYVFSQESRIIPAIGEVCYKYSKSGDSNVYWGYTETEYSTPNTLNRYVNNFTDFKSTAGWTGAYCADDQHSQTTRPKVELSANPTIEWVLENELKLTDYEYYPVLAFDWGIAETGCTPVIVNNGLDSNKKKLRALNPGDKFVCYCSFFRNSAPDSTFWVPTGFTVKVADSMMVDASTGRYEPLTSANTYLTFDSWTAHPWYDNSFYCVATVSDTATPHDEEYWISNQSHINTFLTASTQTARLVSFMIFDYCEDKNQHGGPVLPDDYTPYPNIKTTYYYFPDGEYQSKDEIVFDVSVDEPNTDYLPSYRANCEKIRTITASKSNRFNILQNLCETFECWIAFHIEHDNSGKIVDNGRTVTFHNYVGTDSPLNFVYGIDVKSITRQVDSNAIVTKLIVEPNSNQYAPNGFCTIQTAKSNPIGETTIFNFDYYIKQNMLDETELAKDLYDTTGTYMGYYYNLRLLNNSMKYYTDQIEALSVPKMQADADVQTYQAGYDGAIENIEKNSNTLQRMYGRTYYEIAAIDPTNFVSPEEEEFYYRFAGTGPTDEKLRDLVVETTQLAAAAENYSWKLDDALYMQGEYQYAIELYMAQYEDAREEKIDLNATFYQKYARFIQEGTWIDEKYTDADRYYYDAQSVSYESAMPKLTYTINVIDVYGLPGFENHEFKLGDRVMVEDPEFFGYETIVMPSPVNSSYTYTVKNPRREAIVITELTKALDSPEKNTIKVQTYKNQFQSLFQRVTATVQQVHYATGSYERAAELADATAAQKVAFLQDALNNAATVLTNLAEQSVVWDTSGITVTDQVDTGQKLRIVSGGILMSTDGGATWSTAIMSQGINAASITAGQLNTSLVQIMNGTEAYFRWDALGLTAFKFDYLQSGNDYFLDGLDVLQGVRFDRFGIYGFKNVNGTIWHPDSIVNYTSDGTPIINDNSIYSHAVFALTWDGLYLNLGDAVYGHYLELSGDGYTLPTSIAHGSKTQIGKVNDYIYNAWDDDIPYYDISEPAEEFVKVFHTSNEDNSHYVDIYDDGTIVANNVTLTGTITARHGRIGEFTISSSNALQADMLQAYNSGTYTGLSGSSTYSFWAGATSSAYGTAPSSAPFYVTPAGYLHAESGTIGGFSLGQYQLNAGSGASYVALNSAPSTSTDTNKAYVFWAGNTTPGLAPFSVKKDGTVYADKGLIGGFTLDESSLHSGSGNTYVCLNGSSGNYAIWAGRQAASNAPFSVTRGGVVKLTEGKVGSLNLASNGLSNWTGTDAAGYGFKLQSQIDSNTDEIQVLFVVKGPDANSPVIWFDTIGENDRSKIENVQLQNCKVTWYNSTLQRNITKTLSGWLDYIFTQITPPAN